MNIARTLSKYPTYLLRYQGRERRHCRTGGLVDDRYGIMGFLTATAHLRNLCRMHAQALQYL